MPKRLDLVCVLMSHRPGAVEQCVGIYHVFGHIRSPASTNLIKQKPVAQIYWTMVSIAVDRPAIWVSRAHSSTTMMLHGCDGLSMLNEGRRHAQGLNEWRA